MEFRSILSYLGTVLEINGILAILPVFVSWIYNESTHTLFFVTAVISFISGIAIDRKFRKKELGISSAMVLASVSLITVSLVGAIPFLWNLSPLDAVFESVSGFTTTAFTTVKPESLPYSIVFWRSLMQWAGGLGTVIIFIHLAISPGISSYYGRKPEIDEARKKLLPKKAAFIYVGITFVGFVLLLLTGIGAFDSAVTSMSSVSTGGFSAKNDSIGAYNNIWVEAVAIFLMIAGATSFLLIEVFTRGRVFEYLKSAETRLFWVLIFIFTIFLSFSMVAQEPVRAALFTTISAITTTGFSTHSTYSGLSMLLIIVLMIIGGYGASTAGGIKLCRAGIIGKSFPWIGKKITLPQEAVVPLKYDERVIRDSEVTTIAIFVSIYVLFLFGTAVLLSFMGYPPLESIFQAASAQGNVGLSAIPIESINPLGKVVLMCSMVIGRLEIFPVLGFLYILVKTRIGRKEIISG